MERYEESSGDIAQEALRNQKQFYDARYQSGYMKNFSGLYETCRFISVKESLEQIKANRFNPQVALDYGCGEGRYIGVIKNVFPKTSIYGSDISDAGLKIAKEKYPDVLYISMSNEAVDLSDESCDLIISIEVLEHVADVKRTVQEIGRLLKPNGLVIITTPCANKYSLEWFLNKFKNGLQPSFDGYGRFSTDEPSHLRRLNDQHIRSLFSRNDINVERIYHRTHFFTTFVQFWGQKLPYNLKIGLASLDWHLFKFLPNGANMLVIGRKKG